MSEPDLEEVSTNRLIETAVSDPLDRAVWRLALQAGAGSLATVVIMILFGRAHLSAAWLVALVGGWAWVGAVRMLLTDCRLPRFWAVWVGLGALFLPIAGSSSAGFIIALIFACIFLLFRSYRPYRHLSGSRRFQLGLIAVVCIVFIPAGSGGLEASGWFAGLGKNLSLYVLWSLRAFWIMTAVHLFIRMRLHFLRLKPKLAVMSIFLAFVPLFLMIVFSVTTFFTSLGVDRATRGQMIVQSWVEQGLPVTSPEDPRPAFRAEVSTAGRGRRTGEVPGWLDSCMTALTSPAGVDTAAVREEILAAFDEAGPGVRTFFEVAGGDSLEAVVEQAISERLAQTWTPGDTTAFLRVGPQLWLISISGLGTDRIVLEGEQVTTASMDRLAGMLHTNVLLTAPGERGDIHVGESGITISMGDEADSVATVLHIPGRYTPAEQRVGASPSAETELPADEERRKPFWQSELYLGAALMDVLALGSGGLQQDQAVLVVRSSLAGLFGDVVYGENEFNQLLSVLLTFLAVLFLFVILIASVLGIRITTGITSAVRALHEGTKRIAADDLDHMIEIPNEDEFGALARSFNEMVRAVKRGREEAIARERLERELEMARSIQQRLMPHEMPTVTGFEIAASCIPTRQVGGDYFDFIDLPENLLGVAIGDVSGKGVPAALLMSNIQAALQGQVIHPSTVAQVVSRVNDLLVHSSETAMYATFFYGVLDRSSADFTYCNAGHNPVILLRRDGNLEWLTEGGIVIGMMANQRYEEAKVQVEPGDVLVLYTDGVTEAEGPTLAESAPDTIPSTALETAVAGLSDQGPAREVEPAAVPAGVTGQPVEEAEEEDEEQEEPNMFGEDRLLEVVRTNLTRSAPEIRDTVLAEVTAFTADMPQSDDITLVVIKRSGG